MNFSRAILPLSLLLVATGCSQKGAFDLFKLDQQHAKAVENTRTGSIIESFETKALMSAVYLNNIDSKQFSEGESFVVSIYFQKDNRELSKWTIQDYGYTLSLNGQEPISIEELKETDTRRSFMPVQNNWNKYYFVRFTSVEPKSASLSLKLEKNQIGSVILNYPR